MSYRPAQSLRRMGRRLREEPSSRRDITNWHDTTVNSVKMNKLPLEWLIYLKDGNFLPSTGKGHGDVHGSPNNQSYGQRYWINVQTYKKLIG